MPEESEIQERLSLETDRETIRDQEVSVFKSLADKTRLRLLRLLFREELNVQELAHILQMGQPRISRHLAVLRNANLVQDRREGTKVFYTLSPLKKKLSGFQPYIKSLGASQHPDLERLEECLYSRARQACSFADHKAEQWDELGSLLHSSSASLLALAKLVPQELTIADLGTGTGLMLPFLAALGSHVYAVDQSAKMLEQARLRCRRLGIKNITFIQCPIEELDQQLPECDGILMHFVLHQVARPHLILQHVSKQLRTGGKLVIVDRVKHQDEKAKTTFGSLWLGFSHEQIEHWLKEAQMEKIYWHCLTSPEERVDGTISVFVSAASKA